MGCSGLLTDRASTEHEKLRAACRSRLAPRLRAGAICPCRPLRAEAMSGRSLGGLFPGGANGVYFTLAPTKGVRPCVSSSPGSGWQPAPADHAEDLHRPRQTFEHTGAEILERELAASNLLVASLITMVSGRASDWRRAAILGPRPSPVVHGEDRRRHHRPPRCPYESNSELQAIHAAERCRYAAESRVQSGRRALRHPRGPRIAKICQHSVAKILCDVALVALHDLRAESLISRVNLCKSSGPGLRRAPWSRQCRRKRW